MSSAVVIGSGPGIGRAVAARFARAGLAVAEISRSGFGSTLPIVGDAADPPSLRRALDAAVGALGPPAVVVYNAALIRPDGLDADLAAAWAVNVGGAVTAAAHVLPGMADRGSGTFLVTGGMPVAKPAYVSLSLGKAAVRALVELLDAQYRPAGVHVATVTVDGAVAPGTAFDPEVIAEQYWRLHVQPPSDWQTQVRFSGLSLPVIR
jgi:NAD(P)-dependent dehydrogenase (short-subunit alcohol dehydrogenase family)